jgi:hypothetical protein
MLLRIVLALGLMAALTGCSYRGTPPPPPPRAGAIPVDWVRSKTTSRQAETSFRRRAVEVAMGEWRRWGAQALHRRGPKERDSGYGELVEN